MRGSVVMWAPGRHGEQVSLVVRLCWRSTDPWAVDATFCQPTGDVPWLVGLEVLVAGCHGPAGLSDLTLRPDPDLPGIAELVLSTPSGRLGLRLQLAELAQFLDRIPFARATHQESAVTELVAPVVSGWLDGLDAEYAALVADQQRQQQGPGGGGR